MLRDLVDGDAATDVLRSNAGGIGRPETEHQQGKLLALLNEVTDRYGSTTWHHGSAIDPIAGYLRDSVVAHEPDLELSAAKPSQ